VNTVKAPHCKSWTALGKQSKSFYEEADGCDIHC